MKINQPYLSQRRQTTTQSTSMDSANSVNDTYNGTPIIKRSSKDHVAKRLFESSPPPALIRPTTRKRYFEGVGEEPLNLSKKIHTSPITPVVSTLVKESPSLSLMAVSLLSKAKPGIYDFNEPVVSTPDDFQPLTQRSPIIVNSASPIIVGTFRGKKGGKKVHFNKQNLQKSIKKEATEKPNAYELQLIGA